MHTGVWITDAWEIMEAILHAFESEVTAGPRSFTLVAMAKASPIARSPLCTSSLSSSLRPVPPPRRPQPPIAPSSPRPAHQTFPLVRPPRRVPPPPLPDIPDEVQLIIFNYAGHNSKPATPWPQKFPFCANFKAAPRKLHCPPPAKGSMPCKFAPLNKLT